MAKTYSISELARDFGITTRTIRFYEDQGLLSPRRNGLSRVFSARDRARLQLALRSPGDDVKVALADDTDTPKLGVWSCDLRVVQNCVSCVEQTGARCRRGTDSWIQWVKRDVYFRSLILELIF